MGITCSCKTKAKAALKLYNQIITYIFEQEYGELEGNSKAQVVDGIVLTPHSKYDVKWFIRLNESLRMYLAENPQLKSSLRPNLFKNIKDMLPEDIDLSIWKVKDMEWIKDCPVPKGEDFKRLPILWKE